jgi:8-oxo-dGTP diphosphatase
VLKRRLQTENFSFINSTVTLLQVSKAIIYQGDRLLLQLRDDIPKIVYPNYWGLFGGTVDAGETPVAAMRRELEEELSWTPPEIRFLFTWIETETRCLTFVFGVPLTVATSSLTLTEGQALRLFALDELTKYLVVPKILRMLPKVVESIDSAELTAAWQAL